MTIICSLFGAMTDDADVSFLWSALNGIMEEPEMDPKAKEDDKFINIFIKGDGFNGVVLVKGEVIKEDYAQDYVHVTVHAARLVLSKEMYDNMISFAERIDKGTWGQGTSFTWHKGLPFGTSGKITHEKKTVYATFERPIFGDRVLQFHRV